MRSASGNKRGNPFPIGGIAVIALLCALVLFQGGYYPGAVCVLGAVSGVAYVVVRVLRKASSPCPLPALFLAVLALLYLASCIAHGATFTMLQETASWFAIAGMAMWCGWATAGEKWRVLNALAIAGVVFGALGIAMFAGLVPFQGAVNAGRLMFTVQYANAAGLLFAVFAFLCLSSASCVLRIAAVVPIVALLCTQSIGALAVFAAAVVALGIKQVRAGTIKRVHAVVALLAVVVACGCSLVAFSARVQQASQTFVERIVQMGDAAGLLAANPLFGIGPAQWQFTYPTCQTAQYYATDVHCGYLQIALDAGVLALVVVIAMLALGMWRLAKSGEVAPLVCVAMIAVHALFDFDFQFAAIVVLLAALLAVPDEHAGKRLAFLRGRCGKALGWAVVALSIVAALAGVYLDTQMGALQDAAAHADGARASKLLESTPSMKGDVASLEVAATAYLTGGDYAAVVELAGDAGRSSGVLSLQRLIALVKLHEDAAALTEMTGLLHGSPYDVELFGAVRQLIVEGGLDDRFADAYNAEAARANELAASGHAAWLANAETIDALP